MAPTVSHPLVDDFTIRAQRMRARQQPPGIGSVFPLPKRNDPIWSGSSEIGNEAIFAPSANNRQTILKMEEWGEPEMRTIALGMNYDRANAAPLTTAWTVVAEIQFGAGGVTQVVEVDWRQGSSVSVVANAVVVNASYPFQEISGTSVPQDLVLRASIAKHASPTSKPTRSFTRLTFNNAFATGPVIRIPPFAKNVKIFPETGPLKISQFQFYTNAFIVQSMGTDTFLDSLTFPATQQLEWFDFTNQLVGAFRPIPLLEGMRTISLVWAVAGVPTPPPLSFGFSVEFELAL
jgi:hypothetical protein